MVRSPLLTSLNNNAVAACALMLISFSEFHSIRLIQLWGYPIEVLDASGILRGTPQFRVDQSRLLGPYLVDAVAHLGHLPFEEAYKFCLFALIVIANLLCLFLTAKITSSIQSSLIWTTLFAALVVALQDSQWFYIWDAIDLSTMLVFAYIVLYGKSDIGLVAVLFLVELMNRESAGFIALWLIATGLFSAIVNRSCLRRSYGDTIAGCVMLLLGVWWTHAIRGLLFKHSFDPDIGLDPYHSDNWEQFALVRNLHNFVQPDNNSAFLIALLCCAGLLLMIYRLFRAHGRFALPSVAVILAMALAVWLFGVVDETRVWLEFIPFAIIFAAMQSSRSGLVARARFDTGVDLHMEVSLEHCPDNVAG